MIAEVDGLPERFEFGKACEALYHFAWDEFCDWYLELAKVPLMSGDEAIADRTRQVFGFVLDHLLRCCTRRMPFAHRRAVVRADRRGLGDDGGLAAL